MKLEVFTEDGNALVEGEDDRIMHKRKPAGGDGQIQIRGSAGLCSQSRKDQRRKQQLKRH
jgi:hypothetical protein